MCTNNIFTELLSYLYQGLCIFLPLLYIFKFITYKSKKKKKYGRAIIITIMIIAVMLGIKYAARYNSCLDCYINNKCEKEVIIDKPQETTKKISTTSKKMTTTTTTKRIVSNDSSYDSSKYKKIDYIKGEKINKGTTSKGFKIEEVNGVTYIDGYLIANKTYGLPESYEPENTKKYKLTPEVTEYLNDLITAAKKAGHQIKGQSGYRPYSTQKGLYDGYVSRSGKEAADTYSARPGYSEHQTGYAMDVCDNNLDGSYCITQKYSDTPSANWLSNNCYKYGFILRYVKNKTNETGYVYEAWHFRYVGFDLAEKLYNNGNWLTMEDYFGITSKYQN